VILILPPIVVLIAEGGVSMSGGALVGAAVLVGFEIVCPLSSSFNMQAGLTLSADTRSFSILSFRDKTW
jgi:hypothetical protein